MVKGAIRNMIVLRDTESELYEEAYFLLREHSDRPLPSHETLLEEANRILKTKAVPRPHTKRSTRTDGICWFLLGLFSGIGFAFLLMAI